MRESGRPERGRGVGVGGRPLRTPEGRARVCDLSSECKGKPPEGTFDLLICMLTCHYRKFQTFTKQEKIA